MGEGCQRMREREDVFCMSKALKMELPLWDLGSPNHQLQSKCEHISYWDWAGERGEGIGGWTP